MLRLLEEVRESTPRRNAYLGDRKLTKLQATLEELTKRDVSWKTLARIHYDIGLAELQLGRTQEALASFDASLTRLKEHPEDTWPPFAPKLLYDRAVGFLRWGETQNCVARHSAQSCLLPIESDGIHVDQEGSRRAMEAFREVRRRSERDSALELSARWLLNVAAMTVGEYPEGLEPEERIAPEVFASDVDFPRFRDVAPDLGIAGFDLSGGALAEDWNADGFVDVLSSTWDTSGPLRLFLNRGEDGFEDHTEAAGLTGILGGLNLVHADYDDDGALDVLVLRGGWLWGERGQHPNSLLHNEGGARFTDRTFLAGLGEVHYPTQTASFADYDLDGDLDLFVGNEATREDPFPCQLFENRGDGTFADVAEEAGVSNRRFTKGVTWGDYDGDRYPDLFLSNLGSPNRLFRNKGDGSFEDRTNALGLQLPINSFATWFWDFDNDGALDIYVASYDQGQPDADYRLEPVVASYLGLETRGERSMLYRGDGRGGFEEVGAKCGLERITLPMGANFGDLDNDGFLDFYLGTGYPYYDGLIPNVMYWNRAGTRFDDVTSAGGFGHLQKGHGVAFADFDNDGDQDVFEQIGGAYPGDRFGNVLFENPGFGNHWIEISLVGVEENRFGLGATLALSFSADGGDEDELRSVYRTVNTGGSFGGNSYTQLIGVGKAEVVRELRVLWPRSATVQVFRDLAVNRHYELTEGQEEPRLVPQRRTSLRD